MNTAEQDIEIWAAGEDANGFNKERNDFDDLHALMMHPNDSECEDEIREALGTEELVSRFQVAIARYYVMAISGGHMHSGEIMLPQPPSGTLCCEALSMAYEIIENNRDDDAA